MSNFREQFAENGFVLLKQVIAPALLREMQADMEALIARRDNGKTSSDSRHQTILEPASFRRSFVEFLNIPALHRAAADILGEEYSFAGLAVLLGRATHALCKWHRDFPDSNSETPELLTNPATHIQFNGAIFDDASLWVVPGSSRRPSTAAESAFEQKQKGLKFIDDFAVAEAATPDPLGGMPGAQHVPLKAGDCLLYSSVIWHAAEYRPEWKRATLHGGWRDPQYVPRFKALQWGLEHNPWLMNPSYLGDLGPHFGPSLIRYQEHVRRFANSAAAK